MGTHYNKMKDKPISILHGFAISLLCLHILIHSPHFVAGQKGDQVPISLSDFRALQSIREDLIDPRGSLGSWNLRSRNETCSLGRWVGIRCMNGQVVAIHLPFKSLRGTLSSKIGMLKGLRSLSLHDNLIGGPIPSSLGSLPNLRGLYLFSNQFSGSIPPSLGNSSHHLISIDLGDNLLSGSIPPLFLTGSPRIHKLNLSYNSLSGGIPPSLGKLGNLEVLSLSHNRMNGTIPYSIANLSSMTLLDLSQNNFSGQIPVALENLSNLTYLNVSNNQLSGQVPRGLAKKFNSSSFEGNLQLCGFSGSTPCPSTPPPPMAKSPPPPSVLPKKHHRKLSIKDIILILMGSMIAILLLVSCVLVYCLVRKREGAAATATGGKSLTSAVAGASRGDEAGQDGGGKLVIFDGAFEFTADDLLSATAETMGKSPYGTMYKATLEDGTQVVVKRLREKLTKGPKEFEEETTALGRIQHPNILPLRAYYLGPKGEKLLVFDYLSKGTLSSFLHARTPEMIVDWPTRMKITIGTARGLNHLHTNQNLIHGNLTSTNVYLDNETNPKIANYSLHRLMKPNSSELMTTNTKKTDIYSLGVMMLELLTGKPPAEGADGSELPQWVASMVKDERTNEVFDLELMMRRDDMAANTGEQMLNTLKLALHLVDPDPEARPEVDHVVQQLEQINPDIGSA